MKNVYLVPRNGMSPSAYAVYCSELAVVWNSESKTMHTSGDHLTVAGTLEGFELVESIADPEEPPAV